MKTLTINARRVAVLAAALAVTGGSVLFAQPAEATTPSEAAIAGPTGEGTYSGEISATGASDSVTVHGSGFSGGDVFVAQCLESFDPITGAPDKCNEGSHVSAAGESFTVTISLDQTFDSWNPHPWGSGSVPIDCTVEQCKVIAADHSTTPIKWGYVDIDWN